MSVCVIDEFSHSGLRANYSHRLRSTEINFFWRELLLLLLGAVSNSACAAAVAAAAGTTDQNVQKQTDRRRWAGVFGGRNNSFFAHSMIGIMQMAALSMQNGTQRKR